MTDRELLEAAARTAGYDYLASDGKVSCEPPLDHVLRPWNPLEDDGDALRLAVQTLNWPHGGRAFDSAVSAMFAVGKLPKDPYAATRRAIVMAAAALAPKEPA